ncbi:hypothetical protein LSH36_162g02012 [Paralvinella palmiformis]|uniref:U3 small nucleolar RNA-associated protein 25 homolog n=1 Tax=Paralvinella palmiformis TaxID=53620 RepID=A0AAD9JV74_9ANNE|nr:hypothetical protein LSH36_162g02012 [Paralvinella palmiformis]
MVWGNKKRGFGKKRKLRGDVHGLTKKQKSHLKQFGEIHPADERVESSSRLRKVEDVNEHPNKVNEEVFESSSSESENEPSAYDKLLSTFSGKSADELDEDSEVDETTKVDDVVGCSDSSSDDEQSDSDENDEKDTVVDAENTEEEEDASDNNDDGDDELPAEDYREGGFVEDIEEEQVGSIQNESDPFKKRFEMELDETLVDSVSKPEAWQRVEIEVPGLGRCLSTKLKDAPTIDINTKENDLVKLYVKKSLADQVPSANMKYVHPVLKDRDKLTGFQQSLFNVLNSYQDLYFPERNFDNGEELRLVYCLHALNHVAKTRNRVINHNLKIKAKKDSLMHEYRDQGLTRPKVLIIVPFRDSALRIVNMMSRLLMSENQSFITNKKRFQSEYSNPIDLRKGLKPEDYEATFVGNIDDHFRIGLGIAKKSLKLYTNFYSADIIIASPLGIRTVIGVEGEKDRDFDFLSSIEVLIFDQMDIFLMQNWDHILHLMSHLHLQPKESHGVDFSRVRMWTLNGWSKFYRQTLIFSSVTLPEINAIFNKHCQNFGGKLQLMKMYSSGSISQIIAPIPQVFHRISVSGVREVPDARFEFFKSKILPQYKDKMMSHTLVFIPSYYDFVRLRNYMKQEELAIQKLCEYTTNSSIKRARSFFYHGRTHFLLFTERVHFYRRFRIRGIRHIIFYELPTYPHYYSEIVNMTIDPKYRNKTTQNFTCEVLYTKYDVHKLSAIVGTERAGQMLHADKPVHMFITGDS